MSKANARLEKIYKKICYIEEIVIDQGSIIIALEDEKIQDLL